LVASGYIIASAGLGFIALSVGFGDFAWGMTGGAWLAILVVAWFCTLIGVTGLLSGLSRIGPSAAAIVGMLEPLTAVILAVVVLGERLGLETVLGGVCILGAVFLLRKPSPRARSASLAALAAAERLGPDAPRR